MKWDKRIEDRKSNTLQKEATNLKNQLNSTKKKLAYYEKKVKKESRK